MLPVLNTIESIKDQAQKHPMTLLLFGTPTCGVCQSIKASLPDLLEKYPKIEAFYIDVTQTRQVSGAFSIYTAPAILLFIDGKESLRTAGPISLSNLDKDLSRYYNLYWDQ